MASSGAPGTRMTSSVSINISTPSFYSPQKKFAPVVAPKPKVNPFKSGGAGPGNGLDQMPPPPAGACAQVGKVGEIPTATAPSLIEERGSKSLSSRANTLLLVDSLKLRELEKGGLSSLSLHSVPLTLLEYHMV
uniref:Uncharacterized protein n=1 Tax=Sphaerodactylus townsendi TaxID=933632 RepID=A0ACB8ES38_9SAUR